jgi:hypothetical protein
MMFRLLSLIVAAATISIAFTTGYSKSMPDNMSLAAATDDDESAYGKFFTSLKDDFTGVFTAKEPMAIINEEMAKARHLINEADKTERKDQKKGNKRDIKETLELRQQHWEAILKAAKQTVQIVERAAKRDMEAARAQKEKKKAATKSKSSTPSKSTKPSESTTPSTADPAADKAAAEKRAAEKFAEHNRGKARAYGAEVNDNEEDEDFPYGSWTCW